ncbi:hypothetical protein BLS_002545 [Venturia inaequalis]|uniref:Uncharacterized protein n=1 Tax=Venturia inaequalis TaxID=5025 RepID=A0A8H3URU2_VENIN|nr:hypothetical protein BLS_002545 [Venturia inaequalis]
MPSPLVEQLAKLLDEIRAKSDELATLKTQERIWQNWATEKKELEESVVHYQEEWSSALDAMKHVNTLADQVEKLRAGYPPDYAATVRERDALRQQLKLAEEQRRELRKQVMRLTEAEKQSAVAASLSNLKIADFETQGEAHKDREINLGFAKDQTLVVQGSLKQATEDRDEQRSANTRMAIDLAAKNGQIKKLLDASEQDRKLLGSRATEIEQKVREIEAVRNQGHITREKDDSKILGYEQEVGRLTDELKAASDGRDQLQREKADWLDERRRLEEQVAQSISAEKRRVPSADGDGSGMPAVDEDEPA